MTSSERLAKLISDAQRTVVFTGAGISTESGIPDFRSPGGVWSRMKPIYFDDFMNDEDIRRRSWERAFSGVAGWVGASPNDGHRVLASLVSLGKISSIITQNVDNLHQDSGVSADRVIELHGNASYAACLECGLRHELEILKKDFVESGQTPVCAACGGIVKTATISFGQPMPQDIMKQAQAETLACDLFIVLGSSLVVYPAAGFPVLAKENGATLAIVNREPTPQDKYADLVLHEDIGPLLSATIRMI